jgi:hypothetical protein
MRKSNTDLIGNKIRLRAPLHRALVQAANKRGVSLNSEMSTRLQDSFDQKNLEQAVAEKVGEKLATFLNAANLPVSSPTIGAPPLTQSYLGRPIQGGITQQLQAKLIIAAEALIAAIEQAPVLERAAIEKAIVPVKEAIVAIERDALAGVRATSTGDTT